jgi:bifunctional ADP-heptose synthase (sugar kinase/adenylyltransferase)
MNTPTKNYFWARDRKCDEVEWYRAEDLVRREWTSPVVFCDGIFELLMPADMRMFSAAREHAERGTVVCGLYTDKLVKELRGSLPITSFIERATFLGYMPIDKIVEIHSNEDLRTIVNTMRPDLWVRQTNVPITDKKWPWLRRMFTRSGLTSEEVFRRIHERATGV